MIADTLLPLLQNRFPGQGIIGGNHSEPCITFPAKHAEVGDIQIYDDGDEITLVVGKFTHGHFSNYDDIPEGEKERIIAEDVADFLEKLFTDQVVLWGSHQGGGGWRVLEADTPKKAGRNEYVWSGPNK